MSSLIEFTPNSPYSYRITETDFGPYWEIYLRGEKFNGGLKDPECSVMESIRKAVFRDMTKRQVEGWKLTGSWGPV